MFRVFAFSRYKTRCTRVNYTLESIVTIRFHALSHLITTEHYHDSNDSITIEKLLSLGAQINDGNQPELCQSKPIIEALTTAINLNNLHVMQLFLNHGIHVNYCINGASLLLVTLLHNGPNGLSSFKRS